MTPDGIRRLQDLRHQLLDPPTSIPPQPADTPTEHSDTVGAVA